MKCPQTCELRVLLVYWPYYMFFWYVVVIVLCALSQKTRLRDKNQENFLDVPNMFNFVVFFLVPGAFFSPFADQN